MPKIFLPFNGNFIKNANIFKEFNVIPIPLMKKDSNPIIKLGKDAIKKWDRTNLVYKFNGKNCHVSYVGETKRPLEARIKEYKAGYYKNSVVFKYHTERYHKFDWKTWKF